MFFLQSQQIFVSLTQVMYLVHGNVKVLVPNALDINEKNLESFFPHLHYISLHLYPFLIPKLILVKRQKCPFSNN